MMIPHDIPILEYDDDPTAVLMPDHEHLKIQLPAKMVFAFLGEAVDIYAQAHNGTQIAEFESATKRYPVYVLEHQGEPIGLCQAPVGAAPAAQLMDWLIGYGANCILSVGSCGTLVDWPENKFIVPVRALRDEGASYHYLPPSRFVELDPAVVDTIEKTLRKWDMPYDVCTTWTTDGFYRETKAKVEYRKAEGCAVVEMECAALAACAQFRKVRFGQVLFTADTLANPDAYQEREWGKESWAKALSLGLELAVAL